MAYSSPKATRNDEYLFGDDLLIAPVVDTGVTATRDVFIPPGSWQDSWTGAVCVGPTVITSVQPLERVPMWYRRGGCVVTAPVAQTVEQQNWRGAPNNLTEMFTQACYGIIT
jgi:alpha-glucosidase (family GH31 glycosyl hydrolase)